MGKRKRNHRTTKNTVTKPPVTRHCVIEGDCNGPFKIVTDFTSPKEQEQFQKIYREWFDHPDTKRWHIDSFIMYFKIKYPNRICIQFNEYDAICKEGKVIAATQEEWEQENN